MSPRAGRTLLRSLIYIPMLALLGLLIVPDEDRGTWFLVWLPLCAVIGLGMDWFVWNRPSKMRDREVRKQQHEARELERARRATYGQRPGSPRNPG